MFFGTLDLNHDGEIDPSEMTLYETEMAPELMRDPGVRDGAFVEGWRSGRGGPRRGDPHGGRKFGRPGGPRGPGGHGDGGPRSGRGGEGELGLLGLRQPVASADANFNRGVSAEEFAAAAGQRFLLLDRNRDGLLRRDELGPPPVPRTAR